MKSVLFVASEGLPFIKSGGLADVVGSLPEILNDKGNDVRVVLPLYLKIANNNRAGFERVATYPIDMGIIHTVATVYRTVSGNVIYYFIEHQGYFERDGLYGYPDDGERFAFYQKAVLEMLPHVDFWPDIMHCHDWHTGMIGALCKIHYGYDERYTRIKHVYTIHNLAFQGNYSREILGSCFGLSDEFYQNGTMRFNDGISFLKTGLLTCDKITTVSDTYAKEILTHAYGENMEGVLESRKGDLIGIVNGINVTEWNTKTDKHLAKNFDKRNPFSGKLENKLALQRELGLDQDDEIMMIGLVSRLTWQKGINLILERIEEILDMRVQFVVLGTGEADIEAGLRYAADRNSNKMAYIQDYNDSLAHRIYASCDLFLMPSLFEPCGIGQLIAMHYGSLPLVRETGGLKDTVIPYNEYTKEGTGFSFANFSSQELINTLYYAAHVYYDDRKSWRILVKNALATDVSWEMSADKYIEVYNLL